MADADLPAGFADLAQRIFDAEDKRGASRVDPPEQEVVSLGNGRYELHFAPRLVSEDRNAAMSLATNLAVADALQAHHTGLFRVMAPPDDRAVNRLRHAAEALRIDWPASTSLADFEKTLVATDPKQAALMMEIRKAGGGASYVPYRDGVVPWHSAMAATYAHATAPLRRLADRYVVEATLAIANGQTVPDTVTQAFVKLPPVMAHADSLGGSIDRAVVDLAEAVMLKGREGEVFGAVVTDIDDRGARMQLCDVPVVARVEAHGVAPGDALKVKLTSADPATRTLTFQRMAGTA